MPDIAEDIHEIADDRRRSTSTSPAPAARPSTPPSRSRASTARLLLAALGVVILLLLFTYRSPVLWILPIFSVVVALGDSPWA